MSSSPNSGGLRRSHRVSSLPPRVRDEAAGYAPIPGARPTSSSSTASPQQAPTVHETAIVAANRRTSARQSRNVVLSDSIRIAAEEDLVRGLKAADALANFVLATAEGHVTQDVIQDVTQESVSLQADVAAQGDANQEDVAPQPDSRPPTKRRRNRTSANTQSAHAASNEVEDETAPEVPNRQRITQANTRRETRASRKRTSTDTQFDLAAAQDVANEATPEVPAAPKAILPKKRRSVRLSASSAAPQAEAAESPATATDAAPSPVNPIMADATTGEREADRPANPVATNAPLAASRGHAAAAYPPGATVNFGPMPPTTTTNSVLEDAYAHLISCDERFRALIEKHPCTIFSPESLNEVVNPFNSLLKAIMSQQISGKAAASILAKFIALFPAARDFPTPEEVAAADIPTLRSAGLSERKAEYIQGIARKFESRELSAEMLVALSDDDLMRELLKLRGVGVWTVEMFACFTLKRMNVFSLGDLGVRKGVAKWIGMSEAEMAKASTKKGEKLLSNEKVLEVAGEYSPYRSVFMWYMWRVADTPQPPM